MNKYAVYHVTDVPYAYGKDIDTLQVRLRVARNDIKSCKVYYKDRYNWSTEFDVKEMKVVVNTELFDFYETDISVDRNRYRYFFELEDYEGNIIFLDDRGFRTDNITIKEATAFQYPYITEADLYKEEKWLQEAVVYQIFVDRFENGDKTNDLPDTLPWGGEVTPKSMFGGDLQGIINKLDYIEELGVDLIYLTPIFKSTSNHKYNTMDYFQIDPQFGTLDTARELVKRCHEKNIRIVFDAVFNHSGSDFFAFKDVIKNGENSKYKDWYFVDEFPVDTNKVNYYTFANHVSEMPKFNTANPEVKEYLLKVAQYWVKEIGIDGWRLDVCDEVDHDFWRAFRKAVKECNPKAIVVGEIMHEASSFLKGDQLDSIMNYPFKGAMTDFFAKRSISAEKFDDILSVNRCIYMDSITRQMWNLFDSHDTARFLTECDNNIERMKLAIAFQFTYVGVPYVYYGDEIGLEGGHDPQSRKCMIWDESKQNKDFFNLYKNLIKIRKENPVLVYGEYKNLVCKDNVIIFERVLGNEKIVVAINNNYGNKTVEVNLQGDYNDLLAENNHCYDNCIDLEPMQFKILKK